MKTILNRIAVALLLVIFASALAFAKVHKATITLKFDTKVGDVVVTKGTYDVRFDEETGDVSILKKGKVIAKSAGSTEPLPKKYENTAYIVNGEGDDRRLTALIFRGTSQTVLLNGTQAASKK